MATQSSSSPRQPSNPEGDALPSNRRNIFNNATERIPLRLTLTFSDGTTHREGWSKHADRYGMPDRESLAWFVRETEVQLNRGIKEAKVTMGKGVVLANWTTKAA